MRPRVPIIVAAALCLPAPASAQPGLEALLSRLQSVDPERTTPADCDAHVGNAPQLNAPDLLYGAFVCYAAKRPVEGNFLLTAGQVRAMPDLRLLPPASKADSDVAMGLYGVIYFQAGGPGDDDVLRQVASRARFFDLFDRWTPAYSPAYDPGWRGRRRPSEAAYRTAIAEVKASRRRQLADAATMYADATYSDLNRRHKDLQRRNPQGFVEGTPNAKAARDLRDLMHQRALALGLETVATPRPEKATAGPDAALRFPPATPEASEVRVSGPDPVVERCADLAETMTIASESRIVRVLVTRSARWGAIWRADLQSKRGPMERLTCTSISTSSRPRVMGSESLAPLPE